MRGQMTGEESAMTSWESKIQCFWSTRGRIRSSWWGPPPPPPPPTSPLALLACLSASRKPSPPLSSPRTHTAPTKVTYSHVIIYQVIDPLYLYGVCFIGSQCCLLFGPYTTIICRRCCARLPQPSPSLSPSRVPIHCLCNVLYAFNVP